MQKNFEKVLECLDRWLENWEETKWKISGWWEDFFVHIPYLALWLLYFILFGVVFSFSIASIVYGISFFLAFLPLSEKIIYLFSSYRPVRTSKEKEKLFPLFQSLKEVLKENSNEYKREVKLYIDDTMDIEAFASGRNTLCVSRGALELLNEEELMALLGHEMGHFYNGDTMIELFLEIAILPITLVKLGLKKIAKAIKKGGKTYKAGWLVNLIFGILIFIPTPLFFLGF